MLHAAPSARLEASTTQERDIQNATCSGRARRRVRSPALTLRVMRLEMALGFAPPAILALSDPRRIPGLLVRRGITYPRLAAGSEPSASSPILVERVPRLAGPLALEFAGSFESRSIRCMALQDPRGGSGRRCWLGAPGGRARSAQRPGLSSAAQRRGHRAPARPRNARLPQGLHRDVVSARGEVRASDAGELLRRPVRHDGVEQGVRAVAGQVVVSPGEAT